MFLAILRVKVIDVEEDLTAVPPVQEVSHEEVGKVFLESDIEKMFENIEAGTMIDYHDIRFNPQLFPQLKKVREKAGPRASGPAQEIIEYENTDGDPIGTLIVDV